VNEKNGEPHEGQPTDSPDNDSQAAEHDANLSAEMRRRTRRSFIVGGVAALAAVGGWEWLKTRPEEGGTPWPLRRALEFNERLARAYFDPSREVQTFPREEGRMPRPNGGIGLGGDFDPAAWRLKVTGLYHTPPASNSAEDTEEAAVYLTLDDIKRLPRVELMTQLKCIEGWADLGFWAGARLIDFMERYPPATRGGKAPDVRRRPEDLVGYVSLSTPDDGYYVGLDMASALHPQTLLVYEMGGKPLTPEHGAPLRLYIPVKYGIKSLKRVGTIRFTDERPADFWAEQGYDWYAGH
jgi:hypothetical protein